MTRDLAEPAGSTLTPHPFSSARPEGEGEDDDPLLGLTLGGCRLDAKIGQGGMGSVYRARHGGLDRDVVVKILPPAYTSTKEFRDRFIREAQAAAKLSHPNVVHVYDVGYDQGLLFYVMELIDGQSLEQISLEGPVAPREAVRLVLEAAKGLGAAHAAGIIHRDIKGANILRCPRGAVKVTDFGVARDMTKERLSASGQLLGTPHYMAPEQAEGSADARSDIYSLGVTLFQLLTGKLPFEGGSYLSLIKQHQTKTAPSPRMFVPATPTSVCAVVERLLKKKPSRRYPNVDALIVDLERISSELTSTEAEPNVPPRRARGPLGLVALVTVAALFAIFAARWLPEDLGRRASGKDRGDPAPIASQEGSSPTIRPVPDDSAGTAAPAPLALSLVTPQDALVFGKAQVSFVVRLEGPAPDGLTVLANGAPVEVTGERLEISVPDLEEGRHVVRVRARVDDAERASLDVDVTVDMTAPRISIVEPAKDQVYRIADLDPRRLWVKLQAEDATPIHVTAHLELPQGTAAAQAPVPLEGGEGVYGGWLPLRPRGEPARTFVGAVTLVLRAEDQAGNAEARRTRVVLVPQGMTLVQGGLFRTGSDEPGSSSPVREFPTSQPFFVDTHEVTNAAYQAFVSAGGGAPPRSPTWQGDRHREGTGGLPVQGVGYAQAQSFARFRGRRLPTETEWEKAAGWDEAKQRSRRYPWGDDGETDNANTADYWMRRGAEARPLPVGSLDRDKSPSGCFDMAGNLQEWTTQSVAASGTKQVLKGGCYLDRLATAATFRREEHSAKATLEQFGFRCVRDLNPGDEVDP